MEQSSSYNAYLISIHALLAESDSGGHVSEPRSKDFYPRSPCGERHNDYAECYIHAPISIHALLAESDIISIVLLILPIRFLSTLSLRRATEKALQCVETPAFLSTLSLRRATLAGPSGPAFLYNFYPRSPCGERRINRNITNCERKFLSTLSLRRATFNVSGSAKQAAYFYPRSPCGERPPRVIREPATNRFLSTLSLRRATVILRKRDTPLTISIHALLAESDNRRPIFFGQAE